MLTLLVLLVPSLVFLEESEAEGPIQVDHIPVDPIDLVHTFLSIVILLVIIYINM